MRTGPSGNKNRVEIPTTLDRGTIKALLSNESYGEVLVDRARSSSLAKQGYFLRTLFRTHDNKRIDLFLFHDVNKLMIYHIGTYDVKHSWMEEILRMSGLFVDSNGIGAVVLDLALLAMNVWRVAQAAAQISWRSADEVKMGEFAIKKLLTQESLDTRTPLEVDEDLAKMLEASGNSYQDHVDELDQYNHG